MHRNLALHGHNSTSMAPHYAETVIFVNGRPGGTAMPAAPFRLQQDSKTEATMPVLNRVLFNVLCKDLSDSVAFYRELFGLETVYDSDWFVILSPAGQPNVQIGLIDQVSEYTPRHAWGMHEGTYLTFVVDDVIDLMDRARAMGADIVSEAVALDYGQTRGLIRDKNGMVIDVSTPTELLAARDEEGIDFADRDTMIDQAQPGDEARPLF